MGCVLNGTVGRVLNGMVRYVLMGWWDLERMGCMASAHTLT